MRRVCFFDSDDIINITMATVDGPSSQDRASDEFNINICGPCKTDDVDKKASHYCGDCSVYLCDNCNDHHRKLPLTKNHRVSRSQVPAIISTRGRPSIAVYCNCNKQQEVQNHCDDHQDVVCDPCKVTKHNKCKVSRIQDKISSYSQSAFISVISKVNALKDDYDQLKKARNEQIKIFERSKEDCKIEMKAFRKEIIQLLDGLERTMLHELESCANEGQNRIRQHITQLTATLKMLETDSKLLEDAKNDGGKALMFAADVQVSKCLQDYEYRLSDIEKDAVITSIRFEKNIKLASLQNELDSLGTFNKSIARIIQKRRKVLLGRQIQSKKEVNVKLPDDGSTP